jgi:two-component system, NarL family, response regulator NreC
MNRSPLRILLVDDHPFLRQGLRMEINRFFPAALVVEAESAAQAMLGISSERPGLVLLDINLPGENGIELARKIKAMDKRIKILIVAGEADPWTVSESLQAGVSGFITKTRAASFLRSAIDSALKGEIVLCPDAQSALEQAEESSETERNSPGPAVLSNRERQILKYIAHGENTKATASLLQISPKTVETHRQHVMRKLGLHTIAGLTRYAIRHGLILP